MLDLYPYYTKNQPKGLIISNHYLIIMYGLSFLGKKSKNVKDIVILILLEKFPQKTKEIHTQLRKNYGLSVTYQGVHKAILQLQDAGILERTPEGYILQENWIKNIELFIQMYQAHHSKTQDKVLQQVQDLKEGESKIIAVPTLFEALRIQIYIRDCFREQFMDTPFEQRPIRVNHDYYLYRFVINPFDTHKAYLEPKFRFPIYYLVEGDTAVDRESVQLVKTYPGVRDIDQFLLGRKLPRGCQLAVYDDLVLEFNFPAEFKKKMDAFFISAKSIAQFTSLEFFKEVVTAPHKIKLVLYKDRDLAVRFVS